MKLNGQSRSFVRQVQVDLLALCDADLIQIVHQWVEASNPSGLFPDVPGDARSVLGYTREPVEATALPYLPSADGEGPEMWCAPSPHQLRALLTSMDVHAFAQYVIHLAFQALHSLYPEWYDGMTFNAHLANYLRRISNEAAKQKPMSRPLKTG